MSITINNVTYKLQTASGSNNFLKGGVGEWGLFSCNFEAYPYFQPDRGASLSIISPNIIRMDNGDIWNDYGFAEGDLLKLRYAITFKYKDPSGATDLNFTTLAVATTQFKVEYIDDNIMYVNSIITTFDGQFFYSTDSLTDYNAISDSNHTKLSDRAE